MNNEKSNIIIYITEDGLIKIDTIFVEKKFGYLWIKWPGYLIEINHQFLGI